MAGLSQSVSGTYAFKVRVLEAETLVLDLSENVASQGGRERCFFVSVSSFSGSGAGKTRELLVRTLEQGSSPLSLSPSHYPGVDRDRRVRRTEPSQTPWINRSFVNHENIHREPEAPFLSLDEDEVLAGAAVLGSHRSRR